MTISTIFQMDVLLDFRGSRFVLMLQPWPLGA
ncbi:hypothetical protein SCNU_10114 [Gordonia neofelifaecis NRRL B-59395]|uniref:Uncharacterized protein n=1 Tax=Gordonia neofelifaecis NRRL B-59395 TaxID=644548 RepID=F1YJI6_9ACTN|nr:hypothetical protein SCNU_10114 [Gordonia neofelifaecis NRRL B-59395]